MQATPPSKPAPVQIAPFDLYPGRPTNLSDLRTRAGASSDCHEPGTDSRDVCFCDATDVSEASIVGTRKRKQQSDPERIVLLALTFGLSAAIWLIATGRLHP